MVKYNTTKFSEKTTKSLNHSLGHSFEFQEASGEILLTEIRVKDQYHFQRGTHTGPAPCLVFQWTNGDLLKYYLSFLSLGKNTLVMYFIFLENFIRWMELSMLGNHSSGDCFSVCLYKQIWWMVAHPLASRLCTTLLTLLTANPFLS